MNGLQFFETRMGHTFYEGTMPRIATALSTIAKELVAQREMYETAKAAKDAASKATAPLKPIPNDVGLAEEVEHHISQLRESITAGDFDKARIVVGDLAELLQEV
jgi:hypothetical protein